MPYEIALDELMHHGILGMKWGKRNGPPYPLEYKKLSPEEKAQAKSKAIREGNVKEAAANINEFTNDELRQLRDRFNLNQDIAKITASTKKTGAQKVDKAIEWINRGVKAVDAGSKAYNAFAKISNSLNPDEGSQLPIIGEKKSAINRAEGKSKKEMLDMVKRGKLSTKDYKDISERMEAINKTEDFFKPKKKLTYDDFANMIDNPNNYTADEVKEGWEKFKTVNAVKSTNDYKDYQDKKREEKDFYGFYHGLVDEMEHSAKGTSWTKKDHKYTSKEKTSSGKTIYKYAQNKKEIDRTKSEVDELRSDARALQADAQVYDKIAKDAQKYLDDPSKGATYKYTFSDGRTVAVGYASQKKLVTKHAGGKTKAINKIRNESVTRAKDNISKAKTQKTANNKAADKKYAAASKKMKTVTKLARENAAMIHNSWWHKLKTNIKTNSRKAKKWIEAASIWLAS